MDNNLLEGVRRWLEPLPDKSLPALDIQKEFFPALKKMEFKKDKTVKDQLKKEGFNWREYVPKEYTKGPSW